MGLLNRLSKTIVLTGALLAALQCNYAYADLKEDFDYERSSLCMMLLKHSGKEFGNEIQYVFSRMQIPDRFNDHSLGVRLVSFAEENREPEVNIESFNRQVNIGKRMVSKWFCRNKKTGKMNMDLIRERGLYNSTKSDEDIARSQLAGIDLIQDAGESLINNTYLVFNDIRYIDHSNGLGIFKDVLNVTANMAQIWLASETVSDDDNPFENPLLSSFNATLDQIKSFKVSITSYLYRLEWNDELANTFYSQYYIDDTDYDTRKFEAFKNDKSSFRLVFVGKVKSSAANMSMRGTTTPEQLITKVCTRAVDKNIAKLQKEYPDFRIKAPLISTEPIKAYIGMKEDVEESSKFEVLERRINKKGKVEYKRVGVIKPVKGKIWDNTYWAKEEETEGSGLDATYFEKVSGDDFYPGMLIREIK